MGLIFDVFVFEDDVRFSESLRERLLAFDSSLDDFNIRTLNVVNSGFVNFISDIAQTSSKHHIYILDIDLHDSIDGLKLGQMIRRFDFDGYFIFLTSHTTMQSNIFNYRLKCLDFIDKCDELCFERLKANLTQICSEAHACDGSKSSSFKSFLIYEYRHSSYKIDFDDIVYIETHGFKRYLVINTKDSSYPYPGSLKSIEAKLPGGFFRCHKSFILNKKHIERIEFTESHYIAHFKNGDSCLISKNYIDEISNLL